MEDGEPDKDGPKYGGNENEVDELIHWMVVVLAIEGQLINQRHF